MGQRKIDNLIPGTDYVIKVRGKKGSEYGEWSEPLFYTTPRVHGLVNYQLGDNMDPTDLYDGEENIFSGVIITPTAEGDKWKVEIGESIAEQVELIDAGVTGSEVTEHIDNANTSIVMSTPKAYAGDIVIALCSGYAATSLTGNYIEPNDLWDFDPGPPIAEDQWAYLGGKTKSVVRPAAINAGPWIQAFYLIVGKNTKKQYTFTLKAAAAKTNGSTAVHLFTLSGLDPRIFDADNSLGYYLDVIDGQATPSSTTHSTPTITSIEKDTYMMAYFAEKIGISDANWTDPPGYVGWYETSHFGSTSGIATLLVSYGDDVDERIPAGAMVGPLTATSDKTGIGATMIVTLRRAKYPLVYKKLALTKLRLDSNGNLWIADVANDLDVSRRINSDSISAKIYASATSNMLDGTERIVLLDTVETDMYQIFSRFEGYIDFYQGNNRFVIPTLGGGGGEVVFSQAGNYMVFGQVSIDANGSGRRQASIYKNITISGTAVTGGTLVARAQFGPVSGFTTILNMSGMVRMAEGDTLALAALQSGTGVSLSTNAGAGVTFLALQRSGR